MSQFDELGYQIVDSVISKDLCKVLDIEFNMLRDTIFRTNNIPLNETGNFVDSLQIKNSFSWYSPFCFESLLLHLQSTVENIVGKKLYPCYSYGRIYYTGASMIPHVDRPSCEYSVTLCISNDPEPWDIWFTDFNGDSKPISLNAGDMCVYQGTKLKHWRCEYTGKKQIQTFLHFVDADGDYADMKYDKRQFLGMPSVNK
jgi:hypothetical protein